MNPDEKDCERIFFEVLERTIRLWSHVDDSCSQATRPNRRKTAQEAIARTLTRGLAQNLRYIIEMYNNKAVSVTERINQLHVSLQSLAEIHTGPLSAVPRPHEPIELVSYIRQALGSYPDHLSRPFSPPHVYATENLDDQAHARFDHVEDNNFKVTSELTMVAHEPVAFAKLIIEELSPPKIISANSANSANEESAQRDNRDKAIGFVSLPRIDLGNPLRWPSLMHETGHFEQDTMPDIGAAFSEFLGVEVRSKAAECMARYLTNIGRDPSEGEGEGEGEIRKWLVECWCDAHATRVAGPPAILSQMHAFLFSTPCYLTEPALGDGYPPAWFRLRLMRAMISTRHKGESPSNQLINKIISDEWNALESLFPPESGANILKNAALRDIFNYFHIFFVSLFPQNLWLSQSEINPNDLTELIEDLSDGLPIPTHRNFVGNNQTLASHAEILLAGWAYRNGGLKNLLLEIVGAENFQLDSALPQMMAVIDRADAALQMSIQVTEWFRILAQPAGRDIAESIANTLPANAASENTAGLLTDREIVALLKDRKMRIIPLIGGISAIEGTTVDVRLGHNFEIFFTNISGSMDALNRNKPNVVDSMEVDYDSLEGLEIAPGQFVLGHTLEYLKLPRNVAAEVNGRSSFARLGIEVHMTAPNVEAGFDGCLTFEISNSGHSSVKLYPGMRIAQLRFYRCVSEPKTSYGDRSGVKYRGRLRHNKTAQFNDWEIDAFFAEMDRRTVK